MARVKVKQLVPGAEGQVLKTVSGVPTWAAESGGSGVTAVGSPSITKMEPISLSGPASYAAGGFAATFGNLVAVQRAIICLVAGAFYLFKVTAKSTNTVTIRCFRAVNAHTHAFTGTSHGHTLTMNAHTHSLTMNAHTHSLTMNSHGHSFVATAGSGTLALGMATSSVHIPTGNPTRTVPAGSATGVQNTTDTGTVGSTTSTGTVGNTTSTGTIGNTVAGGTNANTNVDTLEEVANGTNLSGVTLELLGFGT